MQTLVLRIPDDLARELEVESKKMNLTKSEVVRRRLIFAGSLGQDCASGFELIADLVGTVEGGPADMSVRKKEYLQEAGYGKSCPTRSCSPLIPTSTSTAASVAGSSRCASPEA